MVGLIGLILSVVLHELFHIWMHWGDVARIGWFPDHSAIAEIVLSTPEQYDFIGEEMVAYMITLLVILVTVIVICRIHDATDTRSTGQILFPKDAAMHKLHPSELERVL